MASDYEIARRHVESFLSRAAFDRIPQRAAPLEDMVMAAIREAKESLLTDLAARQDLLAEIENRRRVRVTEPEGRPAGQPSTVNDGRSTREEDCPDNRCHGYNCCLCSTEARQHYAAELMATQEGMGQS